MAETPAQEIYRIEQSLDELLEQIFQKFKQSKKVIEELRKMVEDQGVQLAQVVGNLSRLTPATLTRGETARTPALVENALMSFGRIGKVEFPWFNGEDFLNWLYRCERFFEFEGITDEYKLRLVVLHLEGKAFLWHRGFMKERTEEDGPMTWKEYIQAMNAKFDEQACEEYEDDVGFISDIEDQKEEHPLMVTSGTYFNFPPKNKEVHELGAIDLNSSGEETKTGVGSIEVLETTITDENLDGASPWTYVSEVQLLAEEILSMIFTKMSAIAEAYLLIPEKDVGVTVPTCINDFWKQLHDTCSRELSKTENKIVMPKELRDRDGVWKLKDGLKWKNEMVFDPGGATFDVYLLTIKEGVDFYSINTSNRNETFHSNLFVKCKKLTEKCVRDAKLDKSSACTVVHLGCFTWNPKLQQLCQDFIGNKELCKSSNSGDALAYGLVIQAALLGSKGNGEFVQDWLLFDTTPLSMPLSDYDHEEGRRVAPKTMELNEYLEPYGLFFPHNPGPDASLEANISSLIYNYYKPSMSLHICAWITIPLLWLYWIEGWFEEIHMDAESFTICLKELGLLLSRTLIGEKWGIVYDGKIKRVHNPTTYKDITEVPCSGSKGAKDIMFPAYDAFSSWSKQTDAERRRHLRKWYEMLNAHREELEQLKTFKQGKPLKEAKNFDSLNLLLWLALNIITAQRKTLKAAQEAYNEPQYSLGHDKHLKDLSLLEVKRYNLTNAKGVQLNIELTVLDLKEPMEECKNVYLESKGKGLSLDPSIQLELAIKAEFDSRDSPRAQVLEHQCYSREYPLHGVW